MYGYIYKTTNLSNNKIYIGQHKSPEYDNNYFGSGNLIKLAIKKYGKQNFKNEILEECNSPEELDDRERYYINKYKSNDISIGYKISNGGQKRFFTGLKHSDESKRKMSESAKNVKHLPTTNNCK